MAKEWSYSEDKKRILLNEPPKQKLRITGHRIASILGLNQYQSPFGAWVEITKLAKLPFEDNKYTLFGKAVESKLIDMIREKFPNVYSIEEYYGNNIERYKWNNFIDDSDVFGGIMDSVATKEDKKTLTMIVECKSSSKPQEWENNNVPIDYLLQGCLYAYLKGLDRVLFICTFPNEEDYNHPETYTPTKDNTIMVVKKLKDVVVDVYGELMSFEGAIEYCEKWWKDYIETGISPEFDETIDKEYLDIIRQTTPKNDSTLTEMCDNAKILSEEIEELKLKYEIDKKEKELKKLKDNIKNVMMESLEDGEMIATYKQFKLTGKNKVVFDEKQFASDNPKVYGKYCTETISYTLSEIKEKGK